MKLYKILFILFGLFFSFETSAQFQVQGSSEKIEFDCFQLTTDSLQTNGKIISSSSIDLSVPFTLYTELFFGNNNDGGEGIAFFLQTGNQEIISNIPSFGLGISGPSIAVEFDTYQNIDSVGLHNDPNFDHIALIRDFDFDHASINNLQGPIIANSDGNIEDGNWYNVKIDWQPLTNTLAVFFNCEEKINYQIDLIEDVFGGNPEVFYGFSASSHLAQNQQEVCVVINTFNNRLEDVVLCQGGQTQIVSIRGGERYNWTPPEGLNNPISANPIASPISDVSYTLDVETGYCNEVLNYEVEIEVDENIGPLDFLLKDTILCLPEIFTIDATLDTIYNATNYMWSTGQSGPVETFNRTGRYDVTVTIDDVCKAEDWVRLTFKDENPDLQLGNDTTICLRSNGFVLRPVVDEVGLNFLWNDGSSTDSLVINRAGLYSVQIENECGFSMDEILINSEDCRNFYMPNAFTPNSDGINDIILPLTEIGDIAQITSYTIYDRWGVQMHSIENGTPNSLQIGWDGTFRGEAAQPGIYVYEIILQFRDGQESLIKGDFTLIK